MRVSIVRDRWLNPWDVGNYAGLANMVSELTFWGRQTANGDIDWKVLRELYPGASFKAYTRTLEVIEEQPDIIDVPDAHYEFTQDLVGRGIKSVIATWDNLPGKNTISTSAKKALMEADGFIARSTMAKQALMFDGVFPDRIRRIPGAVDTNFFKPLKTTERENAVLFVGRLVNEKGIQVLMWAVSHVPGVELWIVGTGPEEGALKKWTDYAGINDRTRWLGTLSRHELADVYRKAKVLAVPSVPKLESHPYSTWLEQFGQVIIEGLASGLPVAGSLSGAIPEVGGDVAGIYHIPMQWPKLAEDINDVIFGKGVFNRMSRAARKRAVAYYDSLVVAEKTLSWYNIL